MNQADETDAYARHILWRRVLDDRSHEFFELSGDEDTARMTGWIVAEHDRQPALITYQLVVARDLSRAYALDVVSRLGGRVTRLRIESEGKGQWLVDGARQTEFDGCTDIDLEWSPATNLFPIRRLMLADAKSGDSADVKALWVRMPHLAVESAAQRYTRLAEDRYRYESLGSDFRAELKVDEVGIPVSYAGIWEAVARWQSP